MINNISYLFSNYKTENTAQLQKYNKSSCVSFGHKLPTLANINIGAAPEGLIGKVRVRKGSGDAYLDVFKKKLAENVENYTIQNDKNEIIGTLDIYIVKCKPDYSGFDPSHVFADELRNFSRPDTPYHNSKLDYYKDIGTRLLQIAQKRSYEANCGGNLKLISLREAVDWYKTKIGMRQEHSPLLEFLISGNPNMLYLPPENKEFLKNLQGGL